ncbi:sperm acrosome membrane-associated protein 6 isoform X4 [Cavia porcellus]|uniref:sperm acrosome membrane-associated protein 6 isoform X4 n=1 Tax=Cavia porcellus TaxID=10141 RepID=UPI002FE05876
MKVEGRKDRYPEARARQRGRERGEGGRRRRRGGLRRRRSRRRRRRKPVRGGGGGGLAAERGCGPGRAREGALGAPAAAASRPLFCPFPPPCVMLPWPGLPSRSCLRPAPPPRGWMEFFPLDRGQLRGRGEAGPGAGEGPDGGPPGRGPVRGRAVGRRGVRGGERRLHRRGRRGGARWARRGDAGGRAARPCLRLGRQRGEAARRGSAGGDYEERSHLHDNFTQMTLSLQEEAAAGGSFEVAFPAAAEKMKRAILELKKVQPCVPPCGIQEVARRFRCQGCYSTLCDLPLDCPVQDMTVSRGDQALFSCVVGFLLPKEEITYSWSFAQAPDSGRVLLPRHAAGPRVPGAHPAGAAHAPRDLLLRDPA